ncbi:MAG: methyl-accepting chemotaxis protein, partial [Sphingobium sp.]
MKIITIRQKLLASFGLILLVMASIGVYGYVRLAEIAEEADRVEQDTLPGLHHTGLIKDALYEEKALVDRHLLHADAGGRSLLDGTRKQARAKLSRALDGYAATMSMSLDHQLFAAFRQSLAAYHMTQDAVLRGGGAREGREGAMLDQSFEAIMNEAQALATKNKEWGVERAMRVREDIQSLQTAFIVAFGLSLLAAFGFAVHLVRSITRPLRELTALMDVMRQGDFTQRMSGGRQDEFGDLGDGFNRMADEVMDLVGQVQKSGIRVGTSMTEIAATSKQQQATASEVAASTTEIGATSREISATSKELARTMNEVSLVAEHAAELAGSGRSSLSHMEDTMNHVMEAAGTINAKLSVLNEKAGNINQVVTTITKVADQTNLLSLNAAIEAEKAGEYGRGFAVVSSEIRRLADQTAVATLDIEEMVKEIQAAVSAGVMGMDKFSEEVRRGMRDVQDVGEKLSEVIEQVQTLVPRFEAVNEGMETQATGAEQISEA